MPSAGSECGVQVVRHRRIPVCGLYLYRKAHSRQTLENSIINESPGGVMDFPAVPPKSQDRSGHGAIGPGGLELAGIILTDQSTVAGHSACTKAASLRFSRPDSR